MSSDISETNRLLWLWLSLICKPGSKSADLLLDFFGGDIKELYDSDIEAYSAIPKLQKDILGKLCDKSLEKAAEIVSWCMKEGVGILTPGSELYPARLRRIQCKPLALYYKGMLTDIEDNVCISMVGTRNMTEYGKNSAYSIAYDLARGGAVVVSGMAKGIDGMSHRGCIDAGGYTIAVLGCGIDIVYPSENFQLMKDIIKHGLVITEFRPFTEPSGPNFPIRNRIISGLSQGTVIIEAPSSSGALITATNALSQGRDLFALPGKVGEYNSKGTNALIKDGAKIITDAADILVEYEPLYPHKINLGNIPSMHSLKYRSPVSQLKVAAPPAGDRFFSNYDKNIKIGQSEIKINKSRQEKEEARKAESGTDTVAAHKKEQTAKTAPKQIPVLTGSEKAVYDMLSDAAPITADEIARGGIAVSDVMISLTMLEIKKLVKALPGGLFIKSD